MQQLINLLSSKTTLQKQHISNILKLLEEGATIPFIARYRKEMSGGATDETLREFEEIYFSSKKLLERKEEIKGIIKERSTLTQQLEISINEAKTLSILEDIYLPFKEQKNTRASIAKENGLEPLAKILKKAKYSLLEFYKIAESYRSNKLQLKDVIAGAQDIIAEEYSQLTKERESIRHSMLQYGFFQIKKTKNLNSQSLYKHLVNKKEKISQIPSYRYLAIMRGVKSKELSVSIIINKEYIENNIWRYKIPKEALSSKELLFEAYKDGLKRLLLPSLEREVHTLVKEKAQKEALNLFGKNLTQLLLTPPLQNHTILGVDPAYKSGCKLAVINQNATYLDSDVIYPTPPKQEYQKSKEIIINLIEKYNISVIAIGNATASRETQEFFSKINTELNTKIPYTIVNEAGASVYSASKIAQEEYPTLDVTIRGAISIAKRLRDPLAEFVKIDPKSLGIGQYQHDLNQKLLEKKLYDITLDVVNRVGVDINSASFSLLSYVAGIGEKLAKNIVEYREKNGAFKSKSELLLVKGLGKKAYQQSAGFIRIKDAKNVLDSTGIHPESYAIATKILKKDLLTINIAEEAKKLNIGELTLQDIIYELQNTGIDPRKELPSILFNENVRDITKLNEDDILNGVVRNITDFGAFIDVGLKNDVLLHISKISEQRISHPLDVLSLNEYISNLRIISIENEKISVSLI